MTCWESKSCSEAEWGGGGVWVGVSPRLGLTAYMHCLSNQNVRKINEYLRAMMSRVSLVGVCLLRFPAVACAVALKTR